MEKPEIAIFSSRALVPIAEAIRDNLKHRFTVTPWTEGFFRSNEISSFSRALTDILAEEQPADSVKVISLAEFNQLP